MAPIINSYSIAISPLIPKKRPTVVIIEKTKFFLFVHKTKIRLTNPSKAKIALPINFNVKLNPKYW